MYYGTRTLCKMLRCSPSTLTKLRAKWAFIIHQERRAFQTSLYMPCFDKTVLQAMYAMTQGKYLDPLYLALREPQPALYKRLDTIISTAPDVDRAQQDKVLPPHILAQFEQINWDEQIANFPEFADANAYRVNLAKTMYEASIKLGSIASYTAVDTYANFIRRYPAKAPVYAPQAVPCPSPVPSPPPPPEPGWSTIFWRL